jgi:hypothetical protein
MHQRLIENFLRDCHTPLKWITYESWQEEKIKQVFYNLTKIKRFPRREIMAGRWQCNRMFLHVFPFLVSWSEDGQFLQSVLTNVERGETDTDGDRTFDPVHGQALVKATDDPFRPKRRGGEISLRQQQLKSNVKLGSFLPVDVVNGSSNGVVRIIAAVETWRLHPPSDDIQWIGSCLSEKAG